MTPRVRSQGVRNVLAVSQKSGSCCKSEFCETVNICNVHVLWLRVCFVTSVVVSDLLLNKCHRTSLNYFHLASAQMIRVVRIRPMIVCGVIQKY